MRGHHDFEQRAFAARERAFHVALEQRGERLLVLPLGMLRRERLHAVEREEQLEVHRLLGPERAVVVEGSDALGDRDEVGRAFLGDFLDEGDDGLLRSGVVPGRQRLGGKSGVCKQQQSEYCAEDVFCMVSFHFCVPP